jgi:hypothetical protein
MSSFTEPLAVMQISKNMWMTLRDFSFYVGKESDNDVINVPSGTKTDFASIPRFLWTFFPPIGKYTQSAVLHDYLVIENKRSWKECADIFLEAMKVQGVSEWRRNTMYFFVRAYGLVRKK